MKFKRRTRIEKGMIEMTPLINVFFLLFIFFAFTSSFIFQPGISVNLPKAVTSEAVQQDSAMLTVTKAGKIYLNERAISDEELRSNLRLLAKGNIPVLIKADSRVSLGKVVEIWDLCRKEGVVQANIATNK